MCMIKIADLPENFAFSSDISDDAWAWIKQNQESINAYHAIAILYHSKNAPHHIKVNLMNKIADACDDDVFKSDVEDLTYRMYCSIVNFMKNAGGRYVFMATTVPAEHEKRDIGDDIFKGKPIFSMDIESLQRVAKSSRHGAEYLISKIALADDSYNGKDDTIVASAIFNYEKFRCIVKYNDDNFVKPAWLNKFYPFPIPFVKGDIVKNTVNKQIGIVMTSASEWLARCNDAPSDVDKSMLNFVEVYYINNDKMNVDVKFESPLILQKFGEHDALTMATWKQQQMYRLLSGMKIISGPDLKIKEIMDAMIINFRNINTGEC